MCLLDTGARYLSGNVRLMSRGRLPARAALACALLLTSAAAQAQEFSISWRNVAGTSVSEGLAGPATGPVADLWFAPGSAALVARTQSGRVFETTDFTTWRLNTRDSLSRVAAAPAFPVSLPESGANVQTAGTRLYAETPGSLYASDDNGLTWVNLTGYRNRSVIGSGFSALAVSPANPQDIAAANQFGVWRSLDGGLSWQGLNEGLPNLPLRKLVNHRLAELADGTLIEANAGAWTASTSRDPEAALRDRLSKSVRATLTAVAQADTVLYAGTSEGQILLSRDSGATWNQTSRVSGGSIDRIWVDTTRPDVALAASGAHLFRTVNGGLFWDEVNGDLSPGQIHGIAADRASSTVYLATDLGLFTGSVPLNDAGPAAGNWTSLAANLPPAPAWDVTLNADNTLTVALDGYGVFEGTLPTATQTVRAVSGADLQDRPAAPGSLVSILGAKVQTVRNQGFPYPVLASSDQSSQVQIPFEATPGTYSLALEGATDRWTVPITIKDAAPAIFVDVDGAALVLDATSGLVLDPKMPVYAGSRIAIMATGLGKVTPQWPSGVPAPLDAPPAVNGNVTVFLDGSPLQVTRAVLAPNYVGYYLVEFQIPSIVNRGASELRIVMEGQESNRVKLYVESGSSFQ